MTEQKFKLPTLEQTTTVATCPCGSTSHAWVLCVRCLSRIKTPADQFPEVVTFEDYFEENDGKDITVRNDFAALTCASCGKPGRSNQNAALVAKLETVTKAREALVLGTGE